MAIDLGSYNTVPERLAEFKALYPDGSLQPANLAEPFQLVAAGGQTFVVYVAAAYRHPDDPRPGVGAAWEVVPGLTNFTKNSELQNAETSAWGRALIAVLAADAKKGIASASDVQNRYAEQDLYDPGAFVKRDLVARVAALDDEVAEKLLAEMTAAGSTGEVVTLEALKGYSSSWDHWLEQALGRHEPTT